MIGTMENYLFIHRVCKDRDVTHHCFRIRILGEIRHRKYSDTVCTGIRLSVLLPQGKLGIVTYLTGCGRGIRL